MTPEEIARIEQEERARMEIRDRLEKEKADAKAKGDGKNLLSGCGLLLIIGFVLWLGITIFGSGSTNSPKREMFGKLNASASFQDQRIVIENQDSEAWLDTRIVVNGDWEFAAGAIPPKTSMRYFPKLFVKSDGTMLDTSIISVRRIDIHATTSKGRSHWNGSY